MPEKPSGRAQLHAFFQFDEIIERPGFAVLLFFIQIGLMVFAFGWALEWTREGRADIFGMEYMDAALMTLGVMIACSFVIFILLSLYKVLTRLRRSQRRKALEAQARDILRKDYKRALRAILKASGLRPSELRPVRTASTPMLEDLLFDNGELESFLGPIKNQTYRAVSSYGLDVAYEATGKDRLEGWNHFEGYFTPFYVVCLFLTETHYVVGEAVCNSMTGQLQRRVRRIPKSQIAAAEFRSNTRTLPLPDRMMDEWLENRRLDSQEVQRINALLKKHEQSTKYARRYGQALPALPFDIVQNIKFLEITLRNGSSLQLTTEMDQTIIRADRAGRHRGFDIFEQDDVTTGWNDITFRTRSFNPYTRGYLDEAPSTENVSQLRSLWSSGRQATNRAFLAFPNFFLTLLTGLILAVAVLWLMNSLTTDTSERHSSSEESGYRMDTPEGIMPIAPASITLSTALATRIETDPNLGFACTNGPARLRETASSASEEIALLDESTPLMVFPQTQATPAGWSSVSIMENGIEVRGYLPDILLDPQPRSARAICAR